MFLGEFEKYTSLYAKGAKKISIRSSYPLITRKPIDYKLEKTYGNYDLFFNRKGLLLHSVHTEKRKNFKGIYGYNNKGILVSAMKMLSEKNELLSLSEFVYDEKGRIKTETCYHKYYTLGYDVKKQHIHTYTDQNEEILMIDNREYEEEYTCFIKYDDKQGEIENKLIRNFAHRSDEFKWNDELVWWSKYEYDKNESLISEISLDKHGQQDGVYEFLPSINNMNAGYKFSGKDSAYLREHSYTFNEKGDWINQVVMNDGEPKYFYDRTIEYY